MMSFPQMIEYVKHFDKNKTMSLKVNYNKLLNSIQTYGKKLAF